MKLLSECQEGESVIIKQLLESTCKKRFIELGLIRSSNIKLIKYAPLKDPIEVQFGNSNFALRRSEASKIVVKD